MDPWRKKNSCKLAAASLTVWSSKLDCVGFRICVILSPSSVRKAGGQMPAVLYPRKGKKGTQKTVWDAVDFFPLELHDVEMSPVEPRQGSPSKWTEEQNQMFARCLKMALAVTFPALQITRGLKWLHWSGFSSKCDKPSESFTGVLVCKSCLWGIFGL